MQGGDALRENLRPLPNAENGFELGEVGVIDRTAIDQEIVRPTAYEVVDSVSADQDAPPRARDDHIAEAVSDEDISRCIPCQAISAHGAAEDVVDVRDSTADT